MSIGLAQRLREGTWALHGSAERAGVMPALLRGALPVAGFIALQRSLQRVYAALESGLQQHDGHPWLAPLHLPGLARCAALQADLTSLHGPAWVAELPVVPVAQAYADHLVGLARQRPGALAAHAYVRYLGDLAGGQALRRVVQKAYGLDGDAGTRFFHFGPPDQVALLARQFRQGLDALPVDDAGAQALVAEAQWAFDQHVRLFEALAAAGQARPG